MLIGPRSTARSASGCVGMLFFLVTRIWGWAIIGIILLLGGLIWGLTSRQVSYFQGGQGQYKAFVSDDNGFIYLEQVGASNYYVMHIPDYSPFADPTTIQSAVVGHGRISFIASTASVGANILLDGVTVYTAHPIERITFTDSNGQNAVTYTNAEYSGNPNGYVINNWPYAIPLIVIGAICAAIMLFLIFRAKRLRRLAFEAQLAAIDARPSPFARELGHSAIDTAPYQRHDSNPK